MKVTFKFTKKYIIVNKNGKQLFKVCNNDENFKKLCEMYDNQNIRNL